jgi:hypothetical protein
MPYYLFSYIIQIQEQYTQSKKYLRLCTYLEYSNLKTESGNTVIDYLDVIHGPAFIENVSETGLCLHPWVKSVLIWAQLIELVHILR